MQDLVVRRYEIQFVIEEIEDFIKTHEQLPSVLDLGCGNGILLQALRERFPELPLTGLEYTPELYELACSRQLPNTTLVLGDMRSPTGLTPPYQIIITERSVINLRNWGEQKRALEHIARMLSFPGRYIMIESFEEPRLELAQARKEMGLKPVPPSVQNVYLKEKMIKTLKQEGLFERSTSNGPNQLSHHFYLSRVLHPTIRVPGTKGKFSRFVDFFEESLSKKSSSRYSPILLRSFEKFLPY